MPDIVAVPIVVIFILFLVWRAVRTDDGYQAERVETIRERGEIGAGRPAREAPADYCPDGVCTPSRRADPPTGRHYQEQYGITGQGVEMAVTKDGKTRMIFKDGQPFDSIDERSYRRQMAEGRARAHERPALPPGQKDEPVRIPADVKVKVLRK